MTNLADAISEKLMAVFAAKKMAARKWVVDSIKRDYPNLNKPSLDLYVGIILNTLVGNGTLQRVNGKFYAPGKKFYEPEIV